LASVSTTRAELLAAAPDVYYVTDHYLNYSALLVRLPRVTPDILRDLLGMAHKFVTADGARRSPSRSRRKPAWFWLASEHPRATDLILLR
jgi:hypothetical protein